MATSTDFLFKNKTLRHSFKLPDNGGFNKDLFLVVGCMNTQTRRHNVIRLENEGIKSQTVNNETTDNILYKYCIIIDLKTIN